MTTKLMSDERRAELAPYFGTQEQYCGCVWLGSELADACDDHVPQPKETVEVVRNYSRKCCKCGKVDRGQAKSFHWNELNKFWEVSQFEFPEGWAIMSHTMYNGKQMGRMTTFNVYICPDCVPSVLEFMGWKR